MKLKNSERMDRAREQMRQKARELKKKGAELKDKAAANSTLQRLRDKMKRKEEEEEARKMGPSQEEIDFNDRMYYDFMKAQKEAEQALDEPCWTGRHAVMVLALGYPQLLLFVIGLPFIALVFLCLLYTSPSPRDQRGSRMPSSA